MARGGVLLRKRALRLLCGELLGVQKLECLLGAYGALLRARARRWTWGELPGARKPGSFRYYLRIKELVNFKTPRG